MPIYGLSENIKDKIIIKEDESIVPLFDSNRVNKEVLSALPGLQFKVTYLHRQVDENTLITQYDENLDLSLQNFVRINDFIIRVDTPLPSGIPDNMNGSGIVDINITPTPNDVFLMKLPDGRVAMFSITSVTRINYNNETLFNLEYSLYTAFETLDDPIYTKLLSSIVEEFYYNSDFRLSKANPLYTKDEFIDRKLYLGYIDKLVSHWNNSFITTDTNYYMGYLKDKDKFFDPFMERFILSTIGISNLNNSTELLELDNNDLSILDYTIKTDYLASRILQYTEILSSGSLNSNPYLTGIVFSGSFNKILSVTNINDDTIPVDESIINVHFPKINIKNYIFRDYIYRVLNGENINNIIDNLTTYEKVYLSMITGNVISKDNIKLVYENIFDLPEEERFYYIPIFIYILKYYLLTFTVKFI